MGAEKLEGIKGRCAHQFTAAGEGHRLQDVDGLGDVGHFDPVAAVVKDVEIDCRHQGVTQAVLLIEEAPFGPRLDVVPVAPLIHDQGDLFFRIEAIHDAAVLVDGLLHLEGGAELFEPLLLAKVGCGALLVPVAARDGVVMHGEPLQKAGIDVFQQGGGPGGVAAVGSAGDAHAPGVVVIAAEGGVVVVEPGIVFGIHVAAAAPDLVADTPVFYCPGSGAAVAGAQLGHRAGAFGVDVLHPILEIARGARADVGGEIGLALEQLAEFEKFVGAEAVVFGDIAPVIVEDRRALLGIADAVLPVIDVGEAAARPAQIGDADLEQGGHRFLAKAVDVGDGGVFTDPEAVIDAAAEMLGKVAVDMAADGLGCDLSIDEDFGLGGGREYAAEEQQEDDPESFHVNLLSGNP